MKRTRKYIDFTTPKGRNRFYNSLEWFSIRRVVLTSQPYCVECLKEGKYVISTEVDHVIPLRDAPSRCLDITNLQALCKTHHSRKTFDETMRDIYKQQHTYTPVNRKWPTLGIK